MDWSKVLELAKEPKKVFILTASIPTISDIDYIVIDNKDMIPFRNFDENFIGLVFTDGHPNIESIKRLWLKFDMELSLYDLNDALVRKENPEYKIKNLLHTENKNDKENTDN